MPASANAGTAVGEAAIRCRDLAAMTAFYRDIVGLELEEGDLPENAVLLRPREGVAAPSGRVALIASEDDDEDEPQPAPHRLTLTVPDREALARAEDWFRANGLAPERAEQAWIGWACLTIRDPEGNTVELAAPVRQRTLPAGAGADR
jgi:catechol-2,3-dioxygenase